MSDEQEKYYIRAKPMTLVHDVSNYVIVAMLQSVVHHTHKLWDAINAGTAKEYAQREAFEEAIGNVTDTFAPFLKHGKVRYDRDGYHFVASADEEANVHALVFEFEELKTCTKGELVIRSNQPRELVLVSLWSFDERQTVITNVFKPEFVY
jgi:hypothetical protein